MVRPWILAVIVLCSLSSGRAGAAGAELDQSELRSMVTSGQAVTTDSVFRQIRQDMDGEPVDLRAFDVDGVYFRVLVKLLDGRIVSVVVDATTGDYVSPRSAKAREVRELAHEAPGSNGRGNVNANANSNAGGNGNGNSGGNGNGNGGGNGGGNGNGNGNGNNK
jgi:hypothetical protein